MPIENIPSADIVDLRAQQGSDIAQPQRETAPGVDPGDWASIEESFQGDSARLNVNGEVWMGREPKRDISPRAQQFLADYYRSLFRQGVEIDSESQGWRPF
jgi:hypothetical protein